MYAGHLFAHISPHVVSTILGSCVAVCLIDPVLKIGGINHYLLPSWNGEGLPTPRYADIAIPKLIEKMLQLGSRKRDLKAKFFGGASIHLHWASQQLSNGVLNVGERNILIGEQILGEERIPIINRDIGGSQGRKLLFFTDSGLVQVKKI